MSIFKQSITQLIAKFKESFLHSPGLPFGNYFAEIVRTLNETPFPLVTLKVFIFQVLGDEGSYKSAVVRVLADRVCR